MWGDTSGSYDYSEDYYEEPDYSMMSHPYDNSGSDGDYSDNNDYSGRRQRRRLFRRRLR